MKGLEIAKGYYEEFGKNAFEESFADLMPVLAFGLAGAGSECFGYDDEISRDHDFEPGFCVFIPDEKMIDSRTAFRLERIYASLPKEYKGLSRLRLAPVGGSRHGIIRTADFFKMKTGFEKGPSDPIDWFNIPETNLAEAVNGEIFQDPYGEFSSIRKKLQRYPSDVRLKKLAGRFVLLSQAGQYNYARCIQHGEIYAAQLAAIQFTEQALHIMFLLENRYMPFYKWTFRALRDLPRFSDTEPDLGFLLTTANTTDEIERKKQKMAKIEESILQRLQEENLSESQSRDFDQLGLALNRRISDSTIRNADILAGVS